MDIDTKAKLANKLTHALHQAPNHPEVFINVLNQAIGTAGLHITDLSITFGDLTNRMAEQLRAARSDAPPTYENLIDLAGTKINLGRKPEKALAQVLGVSVAAVEECRRRGRVLRAWFDKIRAMPELDETRAHVDADTARAIRALAEKGYTSNEIHSVFQRLRTSRAGLRQIDKIVHGEDGQLDREQLSRMQRELFGDLPDASRRFHIWMRTHLRSLWDIDSNLNTGQVERIRDRFKREMRLRQSDPSYRRVASASELIERPLKASRRMDKAHPAEDARHLNARLDRLFGNQMQHSVRLSQLTGLDERHTLDLLKGANAVAQVWWGFLDQVAEKVLQSEDAPLLRRMRDGPVAESQFLRNPSA